MPAGDPILVFFGVETSGYEIDADILQIYMKCGGKKFDRYVNPWKEISAEMTKINNLTVSDSKLYRGGVERRTAPIRDVLKSLIEFLKGFEQPVTLIAHQYCFLNLQRLVRAIKKEMFEKKFMSVVAGFTDTIHLFHKQFPDVDRLKFNLRVLAKKKGVRVENSYGHPRSIQRDTDLLAQLTLASFGPAELITAMRPYSLEVEKGKKRERLATAPAMKKKKSRMESSHIRKGDRRP